MTDELKCAKHNLALIWEPGGVDMPTTRGRWFCPACQEAFAAWMKENEW